MKRQYSKHHPKFQRTDIIDALKSDPLASFASIAAQCNVTRERVRQVAKAWGASTGRQRQQRARTHTIAGVFALRCTEWGFVPALKRLGFKLEPILNNKPTQIASRISKLGLVINGIRCEVRKAFTSPYTVDHWGSAYIQIYGNRAAVIRRGTQFVIYRLPARCTASGWMVMPVDKIPVLSRVMRVGPVAGGYEGRYGRGAPWPQYLNAWDQLRCVTQCSSCAEVHHSELDCPNASV